MTHFMARADGRIAYDVSGDGPLIICVPGMGELRSAYRGLSPALIDAGYRVARMDLRGHGESSTRFDAYDDVALAGDIAALITELGGGPAVVIGSSMAAGAAVIAKATHPSLVSGLVLAGPFVRPGGSRVAAVLMRLALLRPWGRAAWFAYYGTLYPTRRPADHTEHVARLRAALAPADRWRAFVATTRTDHTPAERSLASAAGNCLVIMGDADPDWPDPVAEATQISGALDAEMLIVPGAGHYPFVDTPDTTTPAILASVARFSAHA